MSLVSGRKQRLSSKKLEGTKVYCVAIRRPARSILPLSLMKNLVASAVLALSALVCLSSPVQVRAQSPEPQGATEIAALTSTQIPALDPTVLAAAVQGGFSSAPFTGTQISFMTPAEQNAIFGG